MDFQNTSLNRSTFEERQKNLSYSRWLYLLLAIALIIALVWTSFCLYYWNELGGPIVHWWEFGLVAAILVLILILAAFFVPATKKFPINWVVYILFVLCFAHLMAFLCCWDSSRYLYFALWVFTAITVAYAGYGLVANYYMSTITSLLLALAAGGVVLTAFIVFSSLNFLWLVLVFVVVIVIAFYLAYDVRKMLRNNIYDSREEDPVSGAVRVWAEGSLVFCRLGELVGDLFHQRK